MKSIHPGIRATLVLFVLGFSAAALASTPIQGRVEGIGPFRVLRVWGTPAEMGYAHGYLLADDILATLDEKFSTLPAAQRPAMDAGLKQLAAIVELPKRAEAEIRGIYDGLRAAKGELAVIPALARPVTMLDLTMHNAGDLLRAFGCSGFTAWGDKTGHLGVVTTRNFDFDVPGPKSVGAQIILVRRPADGFQVATITWPGYIGAFTGLNEHGVCAFMHDGTGGVTRQPVGKYRPLALELMHLLEQAKPDTTYEQASSTLEKIVPYPFSYMVRVITPTVSSSIDPPVRVFRVDPFGVGQNRSGSSSCVTTNHYTRADGKPAAEAGRWSRVRFARLTKRLETTITPASAWAAQASVAWKHGGQVSTLHTLVVYPDKRRIDLAFATWNGKAVRPATASEPITMTFAQLFAE